jgi:hypothetical protein
MSCQKLTTVNVHHVFKNLKLPKSLQSKGGHFISCHFHMTPGHVILVHSGDARFTVVVFCTSGLISSFFCLLNCFKLYTDGKIINLCF